ncbi:MAG TPA: lysozyme inhibitor LprI family protein [Candidatus Polarisedimenticolia bacterium]|nr:lysozyme inhibitor LprI family protein [Candidatus Polarisedimenticolia bacterium]
MNWRVERLFPQCAALLVSLFISVAHAHAQTQAAMNAQARAEFERADAELNKTYQAVLAKLRDTDSKQKLKETQRAWITSRDTATAHATDEAGGGSMAPAIRYETMAELTQQRIKQLKTRLAGDAAPGEKDAGTPSPKPSATSSASAQESDKEPEATAPNPGSVSPDKKWEYKCVEYNGECWSQIVKAGTTQVVVDLTDVPDGAGATNAEILWAPDSKRFAFNYSPVQRHHTGFHRALVTVAFYQLRDDKWEALRSLEDETTESLAKGHVPKNAYPRHCDPEVDTFKLRNWTDANTTILYAACYARSSGELGSRFLFTLKFDEAGNWKIVKARRLSKKELEEEQ